MRACCGALLCAVAALCGAGCLQPASHACEHGGVCPSELRCVTSDTGDLCVLPTCGNGRLDPGESCDDGNHVSGDGCPANCVTVCGDGRVEGTEVCDDGNTTSGDGCSADCMTIEGCGNGVLDPDEACDDGGRASHDGCSAQCTLETAAWTALDAAPPPRTGHAAAYDAAHGTVVVFGGRGPTGLLRDTWLWDGAVWRLRDPAVVPPAREGHAMAYDAARGRVVLFGGGDSAEHSTWEWDGVRWFERLPATAPPSQLTGSAMAYDAGHHRVVLFGGTAGGVAQDGTWEWDGDTWREVATAAAPPARSGHAMAYDGQRGRIVLFGGLGESGRLADTWEYDGTDWTPRSAAAPPARAHAAMVSDAAGGQVVLFGGDGDAGLLDDTWTWDGAAWRAQTTSPEPRARTGAAAAYDALRQQVVLFGGEQLLDPSVAAAGLSSETWAFGAAAWRLRTVYPAAPEPRGLGGVVYDPARGRVVLFGGARSGIVPNQPPGVSRDLGLDDTWEWDGSTWIAYASPTAPSPRFSAAMAFDGQHIVLFGGMETVGGNQTPVGDTWLLVGRAWVKQTLGVAPPARFDSAMAYDPRRGKVVLFGGTQDPPILGDTWEWDGTSWTQRFPVHAPAPRLFPAMAFDPVQGRVLLFGGSSSINQTFVHQDDTWAWDGNDWVQLPTTRAPAAGGGHAIATDPTRGTIVVFDGTQPAVDGNDAATWAWDGSDWRPLAPPAAPVQQGDVVMAYDASRDRMVMLGGQRNLSGDMVVSEWDGAQWHDGAPVTRMPSERARAAMVYDPGQASVMMFGGDLGEDIDNPPKQALSDTWTWDGLAWREDSPGVSPPASVERAMAFDTVRHRAVLYDGANAATWEWDGTTWVAGTAGGGPGVRSGAAMVYDQARQQTLLIGGGGGPSGDAPIRDHWAWDGEHWAFGAVLPFFTTGVAAAYDAARQRVVVFGGTAQGSPVDELWEWDGQRWTQRPASGPWPAARWRHTLVYDPVRRRVVVFGGLDGNLFILNDLWEWDGTAWTQVQLASPAPPPRMDPAMVYDQARRALVLFGGNDTWKELRDMWLLRYDDPAAPDVVTP